MEQTTLTAAKAFARDLCDGQEVDSVFVVRECNRRQKRNGETFLKLQLADASGGFECVVWDGIEEAAGCAAVGTVVRVSGRYAVDSRYGPGLSRFATRYGASLTVKSVPAAPDGGYDPADLAEGPPIAYEEMAAALDD